MARHLINLCLATFIASSLFALSGAGTATAADSCIDNRAVQALIAVQQIKTWPAIKAMAGISDQYTEISRVQVCEQGGQRYYVVNVQGPRGEVRQLVVNAVDGSH